MASAATLTPFPRPPESGRALSIADEALELFRRFEAIEAARTMRQAGPAKAARSKAAPAWSSDLPRRVPGYSFRRTAAGTPWRVRDSLIVLAVLVIMGLAVTIYAQPSAPTPETVFRMQEAELQLLPSVSDDPRDVAQVFAERLLPGWNPEVLFRSAHRDFWRAAGGRGPNEVAQRVIAGFGAIEAAHGRLFAANGREGALEFRLVKNRDGEAHLGCVVTLNAEFANGSTRRLAVTLVRSSRRPGAWAVWDLSMPPFLAP